MSQNDLRSCPSRATISIAFPTFRKLLLAVFLLVLLPGSHAPAQAAAHNTDDHGTMAIREVTTGTLLFRTSEPGKFVPAPTLNTDVHITITGIIARATVKQEFINPSRGQDDWAEGIYVFPLPETAAVDHLRMRIGERIIEGRIKERTEAKQIYDRAKQQGARASLVEQERPNIFTTSWLILDRANTSRSKSNIRKPSATTTAPSASDIRWSLVLATFPASPI